MLSKYNKCSKERTLVIVDDDPHIISLVTSIFTPRDFNVIGASNGEDAFEMIVKYGPNIIDIIVTDYKMPRMNGVDFIKKIKSVEHLEYIPAILLSQLNHSFFMQNENKDLKMFDSVVHKSKMSKNLIQEVNRLIVAD